MPKQKITKEMVVNAAFELARSGGMEQVLVKSIAEKLGCSVQPDKHIFKLPKMNLIYFDCLYYSKEKVFLL